MNAASSRLAWLVAALIVASCGLNPQPGLPARGEDGAAGSTASSGGGIALGGDAAAGKPSGPVLGAGGSAAPTEGSAGESSAGGEGGAAETSAGGEGGVFREGDDATLVNQGGEDPGGANGQP